MAEVNRDDDAAPQRRRMPHQDEDRFRILVQNIIDYAVYMIDPDGRIATWNAGAERLKGYRAEEVAGEHFARFFTEEDRRDGLPYRLLETAARVGRAESEGWRVRKDGTRFWALAVIDAVRNDAGELIGFAKITRDMTERRHAEEALRASERRFRLLVQGVTDYAIFMLDPDGLVANWNSGAERIKGYTADEIIGEHFSRFYTAEDRADGKPARVLEEARCTGRFAEEGWRVRKDGTRFWASVVIDAVHDEDGSLLGFTKVTRDMTERRVLQDQLEETRERLFQAQKLEAIGNLTGGIAHDFNNLLTVIRGSVELAERHVAGNQRLRSLLAAVQAAAGRAAELTHQLLAFSRRQPLRPEIVDVAQLLHETAGFLGRSLRRDILTRLELEPGVWRVEADPRQFELALLNVGLNARDAMANGGTLTIGARNVVVEDSPLGLSGNFVAVSITDQGEGIPPELLAKVIEPFFTTKPVGKGSGLGLSQAYGFAKQSGGGLTIDSRPGEGTTVTFLIPARTDLPSSVEGGSDPAETAGTAGEILVVEDDLSVAELAKAALEDSGYTVTLVHGAREALDRLCRGEHFDAVLSDIIMPGTMNGVELARAIRNCYPELPVLLTTGYSEAAITPEAQNFPILTKPYELRELSARIGEMVSGRAVRH